MRGLIEKQEQFSKDMVDEREKKIYLAQDS